ARQDVGSMQVQGGALRDIKTESEFVGYTTLKTDTKVAEILQDGELTDEAHEGSKVQLILEKTPFYAESGGQIGDKGWLRSEEAAIRITDVKKAPNGQHLHEGIVESGAVRNGMIVAAEVTERLRKDIIKNHTATHLLH
ncbi:alanine--tRNA ligase, partial [Klebsiella pneumoniae]|nr:alanine--tRNA ligase [Klebsiella pneumoniae]